MQANKLTTVGLTLAAIIGIAVTVSVRSIEVQTRDTRASQYYAGSLDARQHVTNMPTATPPIICYPGVGELEWPETRGPGILW